MRETTSDYLWGIQLILFTSLEDPDFAHDVAVILSSHTHLQEESHWLSSFVKRTGVHINQKKNTSNLQQPTLLPFTQVTVGIATIFCWSLWAVLFHRSLYFYINLWGWGFDHIILHSFILIAALFLWSDGWSVRWMSGHPGWNNTRSLLAYVYHNLRTKYL